MFEYPGLKFELAVVPLKVASNDTVYGIGDTNIKIDGGIGAIIIK